MEPMVDQYFHLASKCKEIIALLERCHIKSSYPPSTTATAKSL